jgi:3-dehydroquinate dehydratase-2
MIDILVINGPNLNLLGTREPEKYGSLTLKDIESNLRLLANEKGMSVDCFQSNHEGHIIDKIHQSKCHFMIINPAAFTHTSIAIRDAILATKIPFIEIHLTNIYNRESFRAKSYLSDIAYGCILGLGSNGYNLAMLEAINFVKNKGA